MNRNMIFAVLFLALTGFNGAAEEPGPGVFIPAAMIAAADSEAEAPVIPAGIRNNRYYLESLRLTSLARTAYAFGDYDASADYAVEAVESARLSDEYVALQLKIKAVNDAVKSARARIDWAVSAGAPGRYPDEFNLAETFYALALRERKDERWDEALEAAKKVLDALAKVQPGEEKSPLPAQYAVRSWETSRDCFWNIAGQAWVYGDPSKWRGLYEANRSRLSNPDNPNLLLPGTILDIPSIHGEVREGVWDSSKKY
jgi:tetratricopeptide (TPR) repeat protein